MSYPIPHFRDKDDPTLEMKLALAEAALENQRLYAGRPEAPILEHVVIQPPVFTLPTLRERDKAPALPEFDPLWSPATCGGTPLGFIPTPAGLRKRD